MHAALRAPALAALAVALALPLDAQAPARPPGAHASPARGSNLRLHGGFLFDTAAFAQDAASKQQFSLLPGYRLRDARLLLSGSLPAFKRQLTWSVGVLYHAPSHSWRLRETGLTMAMPRLWGRLFLGRTKEGFSLNKVMARYDNWTMERAAMSDASLPSQANGIKWLGYVPNWGLFWNLGTYADWLTPTPSAPAYAQQQVARIGWLPIRSHLDDTVLHLAINLRYGRPRNGELQMHSRPETYPAPYFVNTGTFPAHSTRMIGSEAYYRPKNWLFGGEYWFVHTNSPATGDPLFRGGDAVASWVVTGEVRSYNPAVGDFGPVLPRHPVFEGGSGAVELVLRFSSMDLNSGSIHGGAFWRLTPAVNWYLSRHWRLDFAYGFGRLNRFGRVGGTQFLQTRLQFSF